jgi:hypothetical protein
LPPEDTFAGGPATASGPFFLEHGNEQMDSDHFEAATAAAPPASDPTRGASGPESLEQVRDILFGGQMRMVESRFHNLEERILQEHRTLRADFGRQLGELNAALKAELEAQEQRLAAERARRAEELQALGHEIREALQSLERRHQSLEQAAGLADADLRDQVLKLSAATAAELARVSDRLTTELDRSVRRLDGEKLDTSLLASLLGEVSTRLGGNGRSHP